MTQGTPVLPFLRVPTWHTGHCRAQRAILLAAGLCATTLTGSDLEGQQAPAGAAVDATAGIYFGDRSSFSGPVIRLRYRRPVTGWAQVGGYLQYRDDTPSGGRAQIVGLGGNLFLTRPLEGGDVLYLVVGVSLDQAFSADRDVSKGPHAYGSVGVGGVGPLGPMKAVLEWRLHYGAGGLLREFSIGGVSYLAERSPNSGMFTILTSTFARTNDAYRQEDEFRGYGIGYDHPLGARTSFRGSLGIGFLEFRAEGRPWSSSVISLLAGLPFTAIAVGDGGPALRVIPELGGWIATEPSGRLYPVLGIGAEASLTIAGAGLLVGCSALLANGPAGRFTGLQPRIGIVLGL